MATIGDVTNKSNFRVLLLVLFDRLGINGPPYPEHQDLPTEAQVGVERLRRYLVDIGRIIAREYGVSWEDKDALHELWKQHDQPLLTDAEEEYKRLMKFVYGNTGEH